ncbi:PREDICTED: beta-1,4-galactosyltransferase galt-1-like [Amphimedon queenslandica]|uniref:Glycosyltransferase family 92 protein n=1 Tax=Amphimedon queenslandica TaxID=400682 RepID=A0A1X7TUY4_AMPQE|nr:PREDICTED: beta-1,4-galactosyltransferase galt-1-like [Amphimedon queenslandica]XP_019857691.1 PREDICTED: beta-1,4-galactosyltransferase galt-1-like [Amphimedon queenslandica]XP_019857692.1 PREDICTED: beta-1,4-galactosyltransferase galt-1-like [Amphimedon queenslandica]XP_019857693.1 PREDICTED: beta-1,4-galactosyltransferase galt-1-like [Amphimedon queenslandica]|eukprot:XP_011406776.2 PREDICTED: beta-1,4-galactosyltransferase galt-1-like [Amphimedon queenslandica]
MRKLNKLVIRGIVYTILLVSALWCVSEILTKNSQQEYISIEYNNTEGVKLFYAKREKYTLEHPNKPQNMWVKIVDNKIIIRRLAFHDTRDPSHHSVVFNCMYDDRLDLPSLRDKDHDYRNLTKLYALITFKTHSARCFQLEYWTHNGERHTRKRFKEIYNNYILRTPGSVNEEPIFAQISTHKHCNDLSDYIPIKDNKTEKNYTYGLCIHQSLYNLTQPEMLVHWVELNIALGAEIMTVYLQNDYISETYYTLMIPYIKKGVVEVLDWGLKPPIIPGYTKAWGQNGVITECIYRNMYRVKYLGLSDLDEFFVPQKVKTIPEMIKGFENSFFRGRMARRASSFTFHNIYFHKRERMLPELSNTSILQDCPGMELPRYYTFTARSSFKTPEYFNKIIVRPRAVISAWIHRVNVPLKGFSRKFGVSVSDGVSQHYRVPEKEIKRPQTTFTMSRYFHETLRGIKRELCKKNTGTA